MRKKFRCDRTVWIIEWLWPRRL